MGLNFEGLLWQYLYKDFAYSFGYVFSCLAYYLQKMTCKLVASVLSLNLALRNVKIQTAPIARIYAKKMRLINAAKQANK